MSRSVPALCVLLAGACGGGSAHSSVERSAVEPATPDEPTEGPAITSERTPTVEPTTLPTTLVADVGDPGFWRRLIADATGPGGLAAFAERRHVTVFDLAERRRLGVIELAPDRDYGIQMMARRIRTVAFIGGERLAIGTSLGIEVVDLHDTSRRQLLEERADSAFAYAATPDGMIVVLGSAEVVRFEGRPLVEQARWRLPTYPAAGLTPTVSLAGERIFVTSKQRLFAIDGADVQEVTLPGTVRPRARIAASMGGGGELLVAIEGGRMVSIDAEDLTSTGETEDGSSDYLWSLQCEPRARLCYRRRGMHVELWRDDLSASSARVESNGRVDPRTGRVVQSGRRGSLLQVADEVGGEWRALGAATVPITEVEWSSRAGEIFVAAGSRVHSLRLDALERSTLENTRPPIAVASDGAVLGVGELAEIIVRGPDLVERRRVYPTGCDHARIARLREQDSDAAFRQLESLEDRCVAHRPTLLSAAPGRPLLAMDSPDGTVLMLDYEAERWSSRLPFGDWPEMPEVREFDWSSDGVHLEAILAGNAYVMTVSGSSRTRRRGPFVTRAENSNGEVAFAHRSGGLRIEVGETESPVALDFEPAWVVAGPPSRWVALGEERAALIEDGAVVATHVIGPSTDRPRVRWSGAQPVLATLDGSGGVRLTGMRDGRSLRVALVGGASEPSILLRDGDRFEASAEDTAFMHLRAGETDLLGATAPASSTAGLAAELLGPS